MKPTVTLHSNVWTRNGHGGPTEETDYSIWLNNFRMRGFSTHGNMSEGYWGRDAYKKAKGYADRVAAELGVPVTRSRMKDFPILSKKRKP